MHVAENQEKMVYLAEKIQVYFLALYQRRSLMDSAVSTMSDPFLSISTPFMYDEDEGFSQKNIDKELLFIQKSVWNSKNTDLTSDFWAKQAKI